MSAIFTWIMAASSLLAPTREHDQLAAAIASRVEAEAPLFKGDEDRHQPRPGRQWGCRIE